MTAIDLGTNLVTKVLSIDGGPIDLAPANDGRAYVVKEATGDLTTVPLTG